MQLLISAITNASGPVYIYEETNPVPLMGPVLLPVTVTIQDTTRTVYVQSTLSCGAFQTLSVTPPTTTTTTTAVPVWTTRAYTPPTTQPQTTRLLTTQPTTTGLPASLGVTYTLLPCVTGDITGRPVDLLVTGSNGQPNTGQFSYRVLKNGVQYTDWQLLKATVNGVLPQIVIPTGRIDLLFRENLTGIGTSIIGLDIDCTPATTTQPPTTVSPGGIVYGGVRYNGEVVNQIIRFQLFLQSTIQGWNQPEKVTFYLKVYVNSGLSYPLVYDLPSSVRDRPVIFSLPIRDETVTFIIIDRIEGPIGSPYRYIIQN